VRTIFPISAALPEALIPFLALTAAQGCRHFIWLPLTKLIRDREPFSKQFELLTNLETRVPSLLTRLVSSTASFAQRGQAL
jgi:hypothetical protein